MTTRYLVAVLVSLAVLVGCSDDSQERSDALSAALEDSSSTEVGGVTVGVEERLFALDLFDWLEQVNDVTIEAIGDGTPLSMIRGCARALDELDDAPTYRGDDPQITEMHLTAILLELELGSGFRACSEGDPTTASEHFERSADLLDDLGAQAADVTAQIEGAS